MCFTDMLSKLEGSKRVDLIHPFNRKEMVDTSKWNDIYNNVAMKNVPDYTKLHEVLAGVEVLKSSPIDHYDYKAFCRKIAARGFSLFRNVYYLAGLVFLVLAPWGFTIYGIIKRQDSENKLHQHEPEIYVFQAIAYVLFLGFIFYVYFARRAVYLKCTSLTNRFLFCIKTLNYG